MLLNKLPELKDIQSAAVRIKDHIHHTPVMSSRNINDLLDAEIFFKCENLQKVGAFKFRGATNAVLSLSEAEAKKGVATHSSGNHAAALSLAARMRGIPAYIVMPRTAPPIKKKAVESYGGIITLCEPNQQARESTLEQVVAETGATFIHPYNNYTVMAGQATAAMELMTDVPDLDIIMSPVGGGGLLSGTALAVHYLSHKSKVIAGEPAGADDAFRSIQTGAILPSINPKTICDGLLTSLGDKTFPIIQKYVHSILTADDAHIIEAMRLVWERMKIIVEPSAVVPLAALMVKRPIGKEVKGQRLKVGIILSGGNVDLERLPW